MKRRIFLLMLVFVFTLTVSTLFCQSDETPEEVIPTSKAWNNLKNSNSIRAIQIKKLRGDNFRINMRDIKNTLEKAGISEPVYIAVNFKNKELFSFGKFTPTIGTGGGKGPNPKSIKFNIPSVKSFRLGFLKDSGSGGPDVCETPPPPKDSLSRAKFRAYKPLRAKLVFKNSKGQVKAVMNIKIPGLSYAKSSPIPPMPIGEPDKK